MNNTKTFAKICLLLHIASAIVMVAMGVYDSFSQSATSPDGDKFLRLYLWSGTLTFMTLMLRAKSREKTLYLNWVKIRHWHIWLVIVFSFMGVAMTNVVDYSLSDPNLTNSTKIIFHFIFTGLLALSALFFSWHYYHKDLESRKWALVACIIGGLGFGLSFLSTKLGFVFISVATGEMIISIAIAFVVWPVINEQLT